MTTTNIFRYKLDATLLDIIIEFAQVHKHDDSSQFREEWDNFSVNNKIVIDREKRRLTGIGYTGDMDDKMYKSARYYFKNKVEKEETGTKKRRKYVTLDKCFLSDMDRHIYQVAFKQDMKPAHAYNNFISDEIYSSKLDTVVQELLDREWKECDANVKIKKTYKNRYFIQQGKRLKKD
jgi:hypothetical protein